MLRKGHHFTQALAAAMILALGMGFGRFAFTGMYPLMLKESVLTISSGSLVASANYAGYLIGALLLTKVKPKNSRLFSISSIFLTTLCFYLLVFIHTAYGIIFIRFMAGLFSAASMISASVWLLHHINLSQNAPLLYSGVGVGIILSAEIIAFGQYLGYSSSIIWLILASVSLIAGILTSLYLVETKNSIDTNKNINNKIKNIIRGEINSPIKIILIYGIAGFGYIITATYLPLLMKEITKGINPIHIWAIFGLGAIPSCFLWYKIFNFLGARFSLGFNLLLQALGVILPVISQTSLSYITSALLVGGTFMGTVTIAMSSARTIAHKINFNIFAALTSAYGIGQVLGPLCASFLYTIHHSFALSLTMAAAALTIGFLIILIPERQRK